MYRKCLHTVTESHSAEHKQKNFNPPAIIAVTDSPSLQIISRVSSSKRNPIRKAFFYFKLCRAKNSQPTRVVEWTETFQRAWGWRKTIVGFRVLVSYSSIHKFHHIAPLLRLRLVEVVVTSQWSPPGRLATRQIRFGHSRKRFLKATRRSVYIVAMQTHKTRLTMIYFSSSSSTLWRRQRRLQKFNFNASIVGVHYESFSSSFSQFFDPFERIMERKILDQDAQVAWETNARRLSEKWAWKEKTFVDFHFN